MRLAKVRQRLGSLFSESNAEPWFQASDELGFHRAQHALGVLYCKGSGVPLDYFQAANWFTRAARQGDPAAETDLGALYESGRGVSLDYVAAYTWYYRAAAAGDPSGSSHLKNLAKIMTRKELDRANAVLLVESRGPQQTSVNQTHEPSESK